MQCQDRRLVCRSKARNTRVLPGGMRTVALAFDVGCNPLVCTRWRVAAKSLHLERGLEGFVGVHLESRSQRGTRCPPGQIALWAALNQLLSPVV